MTTVDARTGMAFEFFFGLFGLISSDTKSRLKLRVPADWRLPTPLNANLFRDSGLKSPLSGASSPTFKSPGSLADSKQPIFSTTGTLSGGKSSSASEGLFSSTSSSSASSIASSGSTSAFMKPAAEQTKKYEFRLNLIGGEKNVSNSSSSSAGIGTGTTTTTTATSSSTAAANLRLATDGNLNLGTGEVKTSSSITNLLADANGDQDLAPSVSRSKQLRRIYCFCVSVSLWSHVIRLIIGLLVDKSLLTLDFHSLGAYKIHFLIPALCLAIQAAAVSTLFIRNNDETNWLVPFYSSKDYLIRSRSNFKPKIEDYTRRVNISVVLALTLALVSSLSLSAYLTASVNNSAEETTVASVAANRYETLTTTLAPPIGSSSSSSTTIELMPTNSTIGALGQTGTSRVEQAALVTLLALDVVWAIYSTYICFLVAFYFNLICAIMKSRFHGISKIIEDLAESNTTKTTNQARKITTLYLEHNEACELLDESNDFWQYLIFFTYFTFIPAYCYCLYNLFFVDFEAWPSFITWVIHTHTGFIILLISFSAAGVSTEAHAPYTSLHTLSLIQLPLDVEVNIATFLHRVRGLTIGYSCYDLFAITNASMSNTAAACASYFLIVADFSRSSVFTLAQMNGTVKGATPTTPTPLQ